MSLNKVLLLGRLGKEPELNYTPSSNVVCTFSIATSETWTDKQGQKQERTEWHNIEVWGKIAENCSKYLSKGRLVFIEGSLQTDSYEKDGETRYFTKIKAKSVQFLSGNESSENRQTGQKQQSLDQDYKIESNIEYSVDQIPF